MCQALCTVAAAPGRTLLTVVHDLELLPLLSTRVIGMADGAVRWDLPLGELKPARLQALYERSGPGASPATPSGRAPFLGLTESRTPA